MSARDVVLGVRITGDARDGIRALDDVESRTGRFLSGIGTAAVVGVGAVVTAVGAIGVAGFNAASDLQQSTGAIDSVFGDWALDIEQAAQQAHDAVGLSTADYENMAAVIGAQLSSAGFSAGEMNDSTQSLISTGADLAATFGGTTSDAVSALSSLLRGETDPIERYGVAIKQSDINARLAATGQDKLTGEALKTATAQTALALITEQTAGAQGAFARESDTAAGAQARLSAWFTNTLAVVGEKLLPIFVTAVDFFQNNVVPAIGNITREGGPLQTFLSNLGEVIQNQVLPTVQTLWQNFQTNVMPIISDVAGIIQNNLVPAFSRVWSFVSQYVIPIFQSVAGPMFEAIRSVIGSVSDAIERNSGKFSALYENVRPVFDFLKNTVAPFIGGTLKSVFEDAGDVIGFVIDRISDVLSFGGEVVGFISDLFGSGSSAGQAAGRGAAAGSIYGAGASPVGMRGASSSALTAGSAPAGGQGFPGATVINLTVNGALDPDAVADQIVGVLTRRARQLGQLPAFGGQLVLGGRA